MAANHANADVLHHFACELTVARVAAARAVDRAEALKELGDLASEWAARAGLSHVTTDRLYDLPRDERERAVLNALISRAIPAEGDAR